MAFSIRTSPLLRLGARVRLCLLLALLATTALAQVPSPWVDTKPLPVDTGDTGLKETLRRLHTTARLMHTVAHPDDEDGGMLTLESRGRGVTARFEGEHSAVFVVGMRHGVHEACRGMQTAQGLFQPGVAGIDRKRLG